jgi:drug/metabolite transporter (DMT)-like permease
LPLSTKSKGYIALSITSTIWGTTWIASKIGVKEVPGLQLACMRQLLAGSILLLFFMLYKKLPLPSFKQFKWLFFNAIIVFVFANGFGTWGVKYIPAGLGALIGALYPLCVVILERIFLKTQKLNPLTVVGMLLGIVGITFVFYENAFSKSSNPLFVLGICLSATAMLAWSIGTILIAKNKIAINTYYGMGWQMVIGGSILFCIVNISGQAVSITHLSGTFWIATIYLATLGTILTFVAFVYSLKTLPATISSLYAYINPIVAIVCGYFYLHEPLSKGIFIGSIITLVGVYIVNYSVKKANNVLIEPEV